MRELSVTTFIDAAPEKVWDVMANRQEEWACPAPWRCEVVKQEKRAGGRDATVFRGPNGEEMPQEGIYLAWDEGRRIVSTDAVTGDFQPTGPFMIGIWEIEPERDGTRYTAKARHWREEDRKKHEEMGFVQGWEACAAQLKAICESEAD
ncbi:ATPase [Altererythrobacter aurantiacus]|uniref:ATPase n=1 Tax=Parapontixanthobacter aurantiacus TaxID=1463599 RepID=A0A844ZCW3_9SPHN|nr:SRPBCC domain-containing protein [Parapontixanthobacter aurantiacus]MXO84847.1 ATPase [Parapontixanthobacter aurantiacus]